MDDLLEECGIEELYPEYRQESIPQILPQEMELEAKYPGILVQFYGEEGVRITGEAIIEATGKQIAQVKATTASEAANLLDKELAKAILKAEAGARPKSVPAIVRKGDDLLQYYKVPPSAL